MTEEQLIEKMSRKCAHSFVTRCRGGEPTGDDGHRWHTNACDNLTCKIAEAIRDILADVRESEGWQPIETAPKDGEIEVRGDAGPYGISSWTGLAHWGLPTNWHRDNATWLSHAGAVLRLAGYYPREWRPIPPPPKTEGED